MNNENMINVVNELLKLKGASIGSVTAITASKERARWTENFNIPHRLVLERDYSRLETKGTDILSDCTAHGYDSAIAQRALADLIDSLKKSLAGENARSTAQIEAYRTVHRNIRVHHTGKTFLSGYRIQKKQLEPGEPKKPVKSSPLTLAKNYIRYKYMKSTRFNQFDFAMIEEFKMGGQVIR